MTPRWNRTRLVDIALKIFLVAAASHVIFMITYSYHVTTTELVGNTYTTFKTSHEVQNEITSREETTAFQFPANERSWKAHGPAFWSENQEVKEYISIRCTSPEANVPWAFGDCNRSDDIDNVQLSSALGSSLTCGLCGQNIFVRWLTQLSQELQERKQEKCSELIVYGVAFGNKYERMIQRPVPNTPKLLQTHHKCFFYFVLGSNTSTTDFSSNTTILRGKLRMHGLHHWIEVPPSILPYQSMRRNMKLFKIYGGLLLFSFAKRIIWQDAKLLSHQFQNKFSRRDYMRFFDKTVGRYGYCASFRGMPKLSMALGGNWREGPKFASHCQHLLSIKRQDVSDSRNAIQTQCDYFEALYNNRSGNNITLVNDGIARFPPSLDSGMIDGAFTAYDMRSERCRKFNCRLGCTWADNTQCFSDRDQVSFAPTLMSLGLYERYPVLPSDAESTDKLFYGTTDSSDAPLVHIGKGKCHWYWQDIFNCTR